MNYRERLKGTYSDDSFEFFHEGPIIRGSTQVHSFRIPSTIQEISDIYVTYRQREPVLTTKLINNAVTLSEADTFKFKANIETTVQLKVVSGNNFIMSPIFNIDVEKGLDELERTYDDDFYAIDVTVNKQSIHAFSYLPEAINDTYLKCKFTFDSTWNGKQKIVYFKDEFNHLIKTSLSYNWCLIPTIILSNPGVINIGVYSDVSRSTIWSNSITVSAGLLRLPGIDQSATECESPQPATSTRAGLVKLYDELGDNIDGAVTQRCVASNIRRVAEKYSDSLSSLNEKLDNAVDSLNNSIDNLNADLSNQIITEASLRSSADQHIENLLNEEIKRATEKENLLTTDLQTEKEAREEADNTNKIAISNIEANLIPAEVQARTNADSNLRKMIESEKAERESVTDELKSAVDDLTSFRANIEIDKSDEALIIIKR